MSSPARRHKHYIAAQQSASLDEAASLSHLGNYDLLLFKMQQDLARLSGVESHETKAELKRGMLPTYMPWVAGVLQSDAGRQDAILMRVLVWFWILATWNMPLISASTPFGTIWLRPTVSTARPVACSLKRSQPLHSAIFPPAGH